jgi:hypothetical protein
MAYTSLSEYIETIYTPYTQMNQFSLTYLKPPYHPASTTCYLLSNLDIIHQTFSQSVTHHMFEMNVNKLLFNVIHFNHKDQQYNGFVKFNMIDLDGPAVLKLFPQPTIVPRVVFPIYGFFHIIGPEHTKSYV